MLGEEGEEGEEGEGEGGGITQEEAVDSGKRIIYLFAVVVVVVVFVLFSLMKRPVRDPGGVFG